MTDTSDTQPGAAPASPSNSFRRAALILAGIAGLAAVSGAWIWVAQPFDSPLVKNCERAFKTQLQSPSGYQRVDVQESSKPLSIDNWSATKKRLNDYTAVEARQADRLEAAGAKPAWLIAFVQYDAPNGFGALVRGSMSCEYLSPDGSLSDVNEFNVFVNGKLPKEWLTK